MDKKKFDARQFQVCTINKVVKEIFSSKRKPKRFLVADEVGLGKTIVAKHVINNLRKQSGKKVIIYVSSSLDITKQNKLKLADDVNREIVSADRVNLIYRDGPLKKELQIITMTPGTSLSMRRSQGSAEERKYMAYLVHVYMGYSLKKITTLFMGACNREKFYGDLVHFVREQKKKKPFKNLEREVVKKWGKIYLEDGSNLDDLLDRRDIDYSLKKELVIKMRMEMAKCILVSLKPSLVIFDEFQKFRDLTEMTDRGEIEHELARLLLTNETPTLLLSATPYKLLSTAHSKLGRNDTNSGHYEDLEKTFSFLTGSLNKGRELVEDIKKYGVKMLSLNPDTLSGVLKQKKQIESEVMQFMSRTERINFGNPELSIQPKFLSNENRKECEITKDNFLEFFRMSQYVRSHKQLFTFWKSGSGFMSYMSKYVLVKDAIAKSVQEGNSLEKCKSLYSKLKESESQHIKLKYVYRDICKSGKAFNYLWIPASHTYYDGKGIFSPVELSKNGPRKGLVFSSWVFVPKLISAEIEGRRNNLFPSSLKRSNKVKLQPSAEGLAKLFFPSTFLAGVLSQSDFLNAKSYEQLYKTAQRKIKSILKNEGFSIQSGKHGMNVPAVISHMEFSNDNLKRDKYRGIMNSRSYPIGFNDKGQFADYSKINFFKPAPNKLVTTKNVISLLADLAISSPSVTLLRSILERKGADLILDEWCYVSSFCLRNIRQYVSRENHLKVMVKNGFGAKPLDKVLDYFKNGNIQAVWDEYLYLSFVDPDGDKAVRNLLVKLSHIFSSTRIPATIRINNTGETKTFNLDFAIPFGEGSNDSKSRNTVREAFNSPFWPFILSTTSMGQEGLDFHLYCNDIYHWNLPSNPVDFEQREGRLNRFNNYAVRKSVMLSAKENFKELPSGQNLWDFCFEQAKHNCYLTDRYSLDMSPNWIYTPANKKSVVITRHVMDMPFSNDRSRYEKLMEDLSLYRLALGQPDQQEFLRKLQSNPALKGIDTRSITLNFFPSSERNTEKEISEVIKDKGRVEALIRDCLEYIKDLKFEKKDELEFQLHRNISKVKSYYQKEGISKQEFRASIEALYFFMDPFDQISDRNPINGHFDDLKKLRSAS